MTSMMIRTDAPPIEAAAAPGQTGSSGLIGLEARTETGRHLVRLAERLAPCLAERAAEHDRDASYPYEAIELLQAVGYFSAPVPAALDGMGVLSIYDLALASSRLAQGDASVAIGVNMHTAVVANLARRWNMAAAANNEKRLAFLEAALRPIVYEGQIIASAASEQGQTLTRPATTATRSGDGWIINGRKIFATMSPAATLFYVTVTFVDRDGSEMFGYARVPAGIPGLTINYDWDALGMRASGSHSLTLEDVYIPYYSLPGGFPAGELNSAQLEGYLTAGLLHSAASLGIAEGANAQASAGLRSRVANGLTLSPRDINEAAENSIDLTTMRAIFSRAGNLIDSYYADHPTEDGGFDEVLAVFAEVQAAKTFINEAAVRVVDRALALSGGAGYTSKHPLSRAYRDVRAGAFMHPLGANRAYEFIAQASLGLKPSLR